jgi:hypothetical protein
MYTGLYRTEQPKSCKIHTDATVQSLRHHLCTVIPTKCSETLHTDAGQKLLNSFHIHAHKQTRLVNSKLVKTKHGLLRTKTHAKPPTEIDMYNCTYLLASNFLGKPPALMAGLA